MWWWESYLVHLQMTLRSEAPVSLFPLASLVSDSTESFTTALSTKRGHVCHKGQRVEWPEGVGQALSFGGHVTNHFKLVNSSPSCQE